MTDFKSEKSKQESYSWRRSIEFTHYNNVLGWYQVEACLEHARGNSVLDLACGDGTLTAKLANYFERVVGVDASSAHLSEARKLVPTAVFIESLIEDLEVNEYFDTVTMFNILEHVRDPIAVLLKASSFLKPDGMLIVQVPNALAINRRIAVIMGSLKSCEELSPYDIEILGHRRSYTMDKLKQDIKKAGLNLFSTGGVFFKMFSTPQMDWFLKNGLWDEGGFGWGRVGSEKKDWRKEFCRACYEIGKEYPEECNIIYACATK